MSYEDFKKQWDETSSAVITPESKSSIKLTKNTKGYNWDIKVIKENDMTMDDILKEIKRIDDEMRGKFG